MIKACVFTLMLQCGIKNMITACVFTLMLQCGTKNMITACVVVVWNKELLTASCVLL